LNLETREQIEIMTDTNAPITNINEVGKHIGQLVTLRGWLYNMRESGKLLFPIFRDGTGLIQGVLHVKSVAPRSLRRSSSSRRNRV